MKIKKLLAVYVMSLVVFVPILLAQNMPPADYVIEGEYIADFQWLPDSTGLRVVDTGFSNVSVKDFLYDLTTQITQPSTELLTAKQRDQLDILKAENPYKTSSSSVVFFSPDKQWVVYGVLKDDRQYLAISHLASQQVHVIYEAQVNSIDIAGLFKGRWSEDSSAFYVYSTDGPNTYMYYVSHFNDTLEDMTVVRLDCYRCRNLVNDAIGPVTAVFDIDVHGQTILLVRNHRTQDPPAIGAQLVALNMKTLTYQVIVEQTRNLIAGSFGPNGEIYYIDLKGMHTYSPLDDISRLISAEINSSWIYNAEISPNGHYVAATEGGGNLYIIPVRSE
jgi:hypothetical protein